MNLNKFFFKPISKIQKKLNNDFIRNLGWLGASEVINRVFRLITTVTLARFLTPYDYGLAALVLTTYEFTFVFTKLGITAKIIQADEENLEAICNSAYWLNWVVCFGLFIIQCIAAFPIAFFYHENRLIIPICVLATVFLISPIYRIQATLIQRENRLKITAITNVIQISLCNILTTVFAILGMGMWAIILPRLLVAPVDFFISLKNHKWRPYKKITTEKWGDIFKFGASILGTSLLETIRNNLDYLIVGRFLGVKELGIYFFAFNAGLGISLSIYQSITVALYPHLCAVRSNRFQLKKRYLSSLKTIGLIVIPFVLLQSSLAPIYVPIIFGKKWIVAIPILIIICLSAIPRPFILAASQLLTVIEKPNLVLHWNVLFTVIFAGSLIIGTHWQILGVAIAVLMIHMIFMPLFTVWANRYVFGANEN